jgi:predicted transcriptional regulator
MKVYFSPEQEARLHEAAERSGRNAEEIVNFAVARFLAEEERTLEELRSAIDQGDADIEAGHYTDYTEDTLHQLFADVRRRGREAFGSR